MYEPEQEKLTEASRMVGQLAHDYGVYNVHAIGLVGSHAYGTAHADSDLDVRGIYSMNTDSFLLDTQRPKTINYMYNGLDITLWEITHYCEMAFRCNPNPLEFLWLDEHMYLDNVGTSLLMLRNSFVSAPAIRKSFGGFAQGQIKRALGGSQNDAKLFKHALRTLLGGIDLLTTGEFHVKLPPHHLEAVNRFMDMPLDNRILALEGFMRRLDNVESILSDEPSRSCVYNMMRQHRLDQLQNS